MFTAQNRDYSYAGESCALPSPGSFIQVVVTLVRIGTRAKRLARVEVEEFRIYPLARVVECAGGNSLLGVLSGCVSVRLYRRTRTLTRSVRRTLVQYCVARSALRADLAVGDATLGRIADGIGVKPIPS